MEAPTQQPAKISWRDRTPFDGGLSGDCLFWIATSFYFLFSCGREEEDAN